MTWRVIVGDCVEVMSWENADSIDAIVTDPPYGLEFMGKEWDRLGATVERDDDEGDSFSRQRNGSLPFGGGGNRVRYGASAVSMQQWHQTWATEALRVLKPGAHLLAFGGTRTYHRLVCALEDAGFEIRDTLAWMYGSGFPKSLDVSKAIDKAAGAEREVVGSRRGQGHIPNDRGEWGLKPNEPVMVTAPATPAAQQWQGFGTALKPAFEPICLARKPLSEKTVAANVQRWGTGALNIDGTRIEHEPGVDLSTRHAPFARMGYRGSSDTQGAMNYKPGGRWPANVLLDEQAAALLDEQSGEHRSPGNYDRSMRDDTGNPRKYGMGKGIPRLPNHEGFGDFGGASRFFYTAKASRRERTGYSGPNDHPTVKPVALMRWLVKLITPPERPCGTCKGTGNYDYDDPDAGWEDCSACNGTGTIAGIVLDPFMGTGTTGIAAVSEGFGFVGIDQDASYVALAERRIHNEAGLFSVQDEGGSIDLTKSSE